jgi:hypothetical protein
MIVTIKLFDLFCENLALPIVELVDLFMPNYISNFQGVESIEEEL